jgi:hypothetical protein
MNWIKRLDPRRSWLGFLGSVGLGLVILFALLDPEPSRGLSFAARLTFWVFHIYVPLALAQGCQVILARNLLSFANVWALTAAAAIAASAIFAPFALSLDLLFAVTDSFKQNERYSLTEVAHEWLNLAPPVTLVWVGLNAARFLRLSDVAPLPTPSSPDQVCPAFMQRIPVGRRGQLVAISAELHYLRVYTTLGESLILHGFGEALHELGPNKGIQIHRSHWINLSFVLGLSRIGTKMEVRLANGLVLPVARGRRAEVAASLEGYAPGLTI